MGSVVADQVLPLDRILIGKELQKVLSSGAFQGSRRCQDFLTFVVGRALDGRMDNIKERIIAVEVFGREAGSDLDHDSIVRVGAREVRKRLVQYYAEEGTAAAVRIELPTGSYVPVFHATQSAAPLPPPEIALPDTPPKRPWWVSTAASALLALALLGYRIGRPSATPPFDAFWQPMFDQKAPALIVMAHPIVYRPAYGPSASAGDLDTAGTPRQHVVGIPGASAFVPVTDKYVGFGDSAAATRVGELMAARGHVTRLRLASKLPFNDLCDTGAVLIGAYTNRWTMELMKTLRYRFELLDGRPAVEDTRGDRFWTLQGETGDESSSEDYMIVSRVLQNSTGQFLVAGAGLTQYGTEEAGRILTTPGVLTEILAKLPASWRTRNLQLVLHSEIVGDAPARPGMVAWYVW